MLVLTNITILLQGEEPGSCVTFGVCHTVDVSRLQPRLLQRLLEDSQYDSTVVPGSVARHET